MGRHARALIGANGRLRDTSLALVKRCQVAIIRSHEFEQRCLPSGFFMAWQGLLRHVLLTGDLGDPASVGETGMRLFGALRALGVVEKVPEALVVLNAFVDWLLMGRVVLALEIEGELLKPA